MSPLMEETASGTEQPSSNCFLGQSSTQPVLENQQGKINNLEFWTNWYEVEPK